MKKLIPTHPRGLTTAHSIHPLLTVKRPYQILTNAVITAFVFTAIPSFAAPLTDAVPAKEVSLNYVSPLMKAIELENQLERSELSPVEVAIPPQQGVLPQSCINGRYAFNTAYFNNGWSHNPHPFVTITLGRLQGSVTASGQYCFDGSWRAFGRGSVNFKNEVLVGMNLPRWRYFNNGSFRYAFQCGLKGEANLYADANLDFSASSQSYETASLFLNARGELTVSLVTPKLTIQRWTWNGGSGSFSWVELPISGPTNGDYVNGVSFEATAFGSLVFEGGYNWQGIDNDPDSIRDGERHTLYGKITGRAGIKLKFQTSGGTEHEATFFWERPLTGGGVDVGGSKWLYLNGSTDRELDKRPRR